VLTQYSLLHSEVHAQHRSSALCFSLSIIRSLPKKVSIPLFILALSLIGCARAPLPSSLNTGTARIALLTEHYGEIKDPAEIAYMNSVVRRLSSAPSHYRRSYPDTGFSVVILKTDSPLAFSAGGGLIAVSSGLIKSLATEGELAFVLSHEIAHEYLGHCSDTDRLTDEEVSQREEVADKMGLGIMAIAGYDPRSSVPGLMRSYRALRQQRDPREVSETSYPSLTRRVSALEQEIFNSRWQPPGTIDKRDFQKLKLALKSR